MRMVLFTASSQTCWKKKRKRMMLSKFAGWEGIPLIEKTTEINMLYDFYYKLLTKKQQSYMEMYYREDYSLGEISELTNVSRQAVYDTIKRTEQLLQSYEVHLSLYSKFKRRQQLLEDLYQQVDSENQDILEIIQQLQKID